MNQQTFRILAVEPDSSWAVNLKRLIHEQVEAEVVIAHSSEEAIAALAEVPYDLVVASALLSRDEEVRLLSYLRDRDATRDLMVLTVPPIVDAPAPQSRKPWALVPFARSGNTWRPYDPEAIGRRLSDALDSVRRERGSRSEGDHADRIVSPCTALQVVSTNSPALANPERFTVTRTPRPRARRWSRSDIRWLQSIQTPWGLELQLLNISQSGLLVESPSKLLPASSTELRLFGPGMSVALPVRVVRSEVAGVTGLGVRYRAAATFDRAFDLLPDSLPADSPLRVPPPASPRALAALLAQVTNGLERERPGGLRRSFERELQRLSAAREVRVCDAPEQLVEGGDSIYFTIPTDRGTKAILQVTFEPHHEPAEEEFKLLKAAAMVAGAVLEYEPRRLALPSA